MKKLIMIGCLITAFACTESCTKPQKWEYKIVKVAGKETEYRETFGSLVFNDQTAMLNKMGNEGWELVSTYTETGTVFPNFGNSEYVTGIRDNTRTNVLNFVFKRVSDGNDNKEKQKK